MLYPKQHSVKKSFADTVVLALLKYCHLYSLLKLQAMAAKIFAYNCLQECGMDHDELTLGGVTERRAVMKILISSTWPSLHRIPGNSAVGIFSKGGDKNFTQ